MIGMFISLHFKYLRIKKKLLLSVVAITLYLLNYAQQLPLGTCGLVYTYDAAGNRLKRVHFCNNGTDPYPTRIAPASNNTAESKITEEIQVVDALYPNPTTGKFVVTFSKELKNAKIFLTDVNGKVVQQLVGNGYQVHFDLSTMPAGVYIVRIEDGGLVITKKVIKR